MVNQIGHQSPFPKSLDSRKHELFFFNVSQFAGKDQEANELKCSTIGRFKRLKIASVKSRSA